MRLLVPHYGVYSTVISIIPALSQAQVQMTEPCVADKRIVFLSLKTRHLRLSTCVSPSSGGERQYACGEPRRVVCGLGGAPSYGPSGRALRDSSLSEHFPHLALKLVLFCGPALIALSSLNTRTF